ncbi:hypothetical protein LVJ94_02505 [Pendulispora rubella]|uniref:Uncharacterized protein n=1 Tax=Pendulispora rubella TaxID=2741070 RepID=A0ABZ2L991_9BACT
MTRLAETFARDVLSAIRSAPLDEVLGGGRGRPAAAVAVVTGAAPAAKSKGRVAAPAAAPERKGGNGRLHRRSDDEIGVVVEKIVSLLKKNPTGLRAEQIREKLSLAPKELPRPIKDALSGKKITAKGQKRATTYFAK